ncbi:hypothetical protein MMH89_02730 [Candidatus Comchoanobacter bicostacola]|uniref:Uncharacterized protein n=1 Tax=Candidatus Comchoanobacter bicostacola TaxID=2919598 RepID=A0ABY5DK89_9GAMM|nr:hypothetical protein [Candidatus Comchoanobacter bicostacola]UTC24139.1 hypothetical protein MMH89_02730 [Candidatus Comchoanobacter bicostacola]
MELLSRKILAYDPKSLHDLVEYFKEALVLYKELKSKSKNAIDKAITAELHTIFISATGEGVANDLQIIEKSISSYITYILAHCLTNNHCDPIYLTVMHRIFNHPPRQYFYTWNLLISHYLLQKDEGMNPSAITAEEILTHLAAIAKQAADNPYVENCAISLAEFKHRRDERDCFLGYAKEHVQDRLDCLVQGYTQDRYAGYSPTTPLALCDKHYIISRTILNSRNLSPETIKRAHRLTGLIIAITANPDSYLRYIIQEQSKKTHNLKFLKNTLILHSALVGDIVDNPRWSWNQAINAIQRILKKQTEYMVRIIAAHNEIQSFDITTTGQETVTGFHCLISSIPYIDSLTQLANIVKYCYFSLSHALAMLEPPSENRLAKISHEQLSHAIKERGDANTYVIGNRLKIAAQAITAPSSYSFKSI